MHKRDERADYRITTGTTTRGDHLHAGAAAGGVGVLGFVHCYGGEFQVVGGPVAIAAVAGGIPAVVGAVAVEPAPVVVRGETGRGDGMGGAG